MDRFAIALIPTLIQNAIIKGRCLSTERLERNTNEEIVHFMLNVFNIYTPRRSHLENVFTSPLIKGNLPSVETILKNQNNNCRLS